MVDRLGRLRARLRVALTELRQREAQLSLVLSLVIGAVVGLIVVTFILLTGRVAAHLYPAGGLGLRRILVPVLGSLISGYLLYRFFPNARGSGIPQTKAAMYIRDGEISLRTAAGKFLCCSISLGSGIALGREGPSVQIGAGFASVLGRKLNLSKEQVKALIPVGGAAALAAAFNTPIAAVLFSLEEIVGDLNAPVIGSVVLASATSWIVLHLLLGDAPLFHVAPYQFAHFSELLFYAVLGVVGGLGSAAFTRLLLGLRRKFLAMAPRTRWLQPVAGGLTVGIMGFFIPDVLGVGYPVVEQVLSGGIVVQLVVLLAVLKLIATAVAYASGNAGGIFGPSLFIGAMLGAAVGHGAHALAPLHTAGPGAYALVGMGAVFAGVVRAPMTSVIMIFEMTRDYSIIVPLMVTNLISFFIARWLQHEPIYEALAQQDGIHLPHGATRTTNAHLRVSAVMHPTTLLVPPTASIAEALAVAEARGSDWIAAAAPAYAIIERSKLDAAVSHGDGALPLRTVIDPKLRPLSESELAAAYVHSDNPFDLALQRMGISGRELLPIVSREDLSNILGIVTLRDVLRGYGVVDFRPEPAPASDPVLRPSG
jgi:CIC family chloride channel protein